MCVSLHPVKVLTFLADAEKARRWILDAMNIVKIVEKKAAGLIVIVKTREGR